jgi:hypothetical protein
MPVNKEIIDSELCNSCLNFWGINRCFAFPDGIPDEILHGENLHKKPLIGQTNNIVYQEFIPDNLN